MMPSPSQVESKGVVMVAVMMVNEIRENCSKYWGGVKQEEIVRRR